MFELLEDLNLVTHDLDIFLLFALLFDGLDGDKLASELAPCLIHVSIRSLPDEGDDVVVLLLVLCHI